uniref:Cystatin domain-containing protein n=1 Tax=Cucumis sativus TaxID=3659 RepID=A0A0A0LVE8_CUCSA
MSSLALQYDSDDDSFKANLLHMTPDLLDPNYEPVHESEREANHQAACGILYYITFDVKEAGAAPELPMTTFQARVLYGIRVIEVELCRPEPPPKN